MTTTTTTPSFLKLLTEEHGHSLPLGFYETAALIDFKVYNINHNLVSDRDLVTEGIPYLTYMVTTDGVFHGRYYGVDFVHADFLCKTKIDEMMQEYLLHHTIPTLRAESNVNVLTYRGHELKIVSTADTYTICITYTYEEIFPRVYIKGDGHVINYLDRYVDEVNELVLFDESQGALSEWQHISCDHERKIQLGEYMFNSPGGGEIILEKGDERYYITDLDGEREHDTVAYHVARDAFKMKNLVNYWTNVFLNME